MSSYEGMIAETVGLVGHNEDQTSGYLARPVGAGPYPGVVVIHEIFGLVTHQKEVVRKLAAHGYVAIAPDLHHREGPGDPEDVAKVVGAAGGNPDARTIGDVEGAAALLRSLPYCNDKVGAMGFCSGGRQTYLVACNIPSLDAGIVCYGGRIVAPLDSLNERQPKAPIDMTEGLSCPLMGLFGIEDTSPSPEQVTMIEQELKRHGKTYEFHTFEDAGHGFFADYRPSYRQQAAVEGWRLVFEWFDKHLT